MAKRRRLEPARIDPDAGIGVGTTGGLGTATMFPPAPAAISRAPRPAPIADVAGDAAATAAFAEVAQSLTEARREGRLIQRLPLDAIDATYLVRDRMVVAEDEMQTLCESLRLRGQQAAIEVTEIDPGPDGAPRWGLISGWRRLSALRRLREQADPDEKAKFDTILAISRQRDDAADAYLAMVEENEIRVGLSYYERARIVARAADRGVFRTDRLALSALFQTASRPKRSKIGSFLRIVRALDHALRFPATLAERAGLALAAALDADQTLEQRLIGALESDPPADAVAEARLIAQVIAGPKPVVTKPVEEVLRPGLRLTTYPDGRLAMSGAALAEPGFVDRLRDWLRDTRT